MMKTQLTTAERSVIMLVVKGLKNKEIARELNISLSTVKSHNENIFRKLDIHSRIQVAVYAIRNDLV